MKDDMTEFRLSRLTVTAALLLALTASGCGLLGATYNIFIHPLLPKKTIPAEHDMSEKIVLIWVDDVSAQRTENARLRRELTGQMRDELLKHKAAQDIVAYNVIASFRNRHPELGELSPEQLGRRFEADEVLHIVIDEFQLRHEAGKGFYRGNLVCRCKVVEVSTGKRLWPVGPVTRAVSVTDELSHGEGQAFEDRMMRRLVAKVPPLLAPSFYKHKKQ